MTIVGTGSLRREEPAPENVPRVTVIRTEASPSGPPSPSAVSSSAMPGGSASFELRRQRDLETLGRSSQPREVLRELGDAAASSAQRLEHAVAELEPSIERREVRGIGRRSVP